MPRFVAWLLPGLLLHALCPGSAEAGGEAGLEGANPIRKVVTMLQKMQAKVTEEGKKEEEAFDKFMCYCTNNKGELTADIENAKAKIEAVSSAIKETAERKTQTEADLAEHQTSRTEAKETMAQAGALREKEAAAYAKVKADFDANLAALAKAIAALDKGMAGSFLQAPAAATLRRFAMGAAEMTDAQRQALLAFLSVDQGSGYVVASGEISGILKELRAEMASGEAAATSDEAAAAQNFEALMAAKTKEVETLSAQIEQEMTRTGELGVEQAGLAMDKDDTVASLDEDTKFQLDLENSCAGKAEDWEAVKRTRAEELVALAETIKVLNDDDNLELFKRTLPGAGAGASFVQVGANLLAARRRVLSIIAQARTTAPSDGRPDLDLLALALRGKKAGFDKVVGMIDGMTENLKKEQADDDGKKAHCEAQLDAADDKRKGHERSISDAETAISELRGSIETLAQDLATLKSGIKALDKAVAEATEMRKEGNAEYKELVASNAQAKKVLDWAKNRLNKFYNPKLYQPPPKRELGEDAAGSAESLLQRRAARAAARRDAPPPPPETFGAYTKKSSQTGGVMAMMDLLVRDLDKEISEAEVMEKDAQRAYEALLAESASKRAVDAKAATEKESSRAAAAEGLQAEGEAKAGSGKELAAAVRYLQALHADCDWLLKHHGTRRQARAGELEAMANAKAVLSGADFALLQRAASAGPRVGFLSRHRAR